MRFLPAGESFNNPLQFIYFYLLADQFLMLHFNELPGLLHGQDGVA